MTDYNLEKPVEWIRITEKAEIERRLIERNKRHLQQIAMGNAPPSLEYFSDLQKIMETPTWQTRYWRER